MLLDTALKSSRRGELTRAEAKDGVVIGLDVIGLDQGTFREGLHGLKFGEGFSGGSGDRGDRGDRGDGAGSEADRWHPRCHGAGREACGGCR